MHTGVGNALPSGPTADRFCSSAKCLVLGGNSFFRLMKSFRSNQASPRQRKRNEAEEQTPPTRGEENRRDQRGD